MSREVQLDLFAPRPELIVAPPAARPKRQSAARGERSPKSASVFIFPLAAHENVAKVASLMRGSRNTAERDAILKAHLRRVSDMRVNAGLSPHLVKADVAAYRAAIWRAYWSPPLEGAR
ncbi:DUF6074 family protein [Mesorhizobium sp. YIM 152430]|uniref:DUF6074 family protein n=1 Tax=Mesorhizobium sp. YIM 152430 TaxID=3031761 RepID=UPI0023DB99A5|nr:DUF6074 family protein [Mesorhizobium sp. YIM 152430]MDF1601583.1 DUF6074 family protein [Mesorhizobium sp. YIM 152430]